MITGEIFLDQREIELNRLKLLKEKDLIRENKQLKKLIIDIMETHHIKSITIEPKFLIQESNKVLTQINGPDGTIKIVVDKLERTYSNE